MDKFIYITMSGLIGATAYQVVVVMQGATKVIHFMVS